MWAMRVMAALALAGCATTEGFERKLQSWVGQSSQALYQSWGIPGRTFQMPDGSTAAEYLYVGGTFVTVIPVGQYAFAQANTTWCKTTFFINQEGWVGSWRWEGNACRG